jgi:hypothetical protein
MLNDRGALGIECCATPTPLPSRDVRLPGWREIAAALWEPGTWWCDIVGTYR